MNWGTKIFLTLAIFMIGMVSVGVYMVSQDKDSLEYQDYYERGIQFDETYIRRQNTERFDSKPRITIDRDTLKIHFVNRGNKGDLLMKRLSDGSKDVKLPFSVAGNLFSMPVDSLIRGAWNVELRWTSGAHSYQFDQEIFLEAAAADSADEI